MSQPAAAAAAAAPQGTGGNTAGTANPQQRQQSWEDRLWGIGKQVLFFFAIQFVIRQFMGGGGQQQATPQRTAGGEGSQAASYEHSAIPEFVHPMWPANASVDISMYISPSVVMPPFERMPPESLVVYETSFELDGKKKDVRDVHTSFAVPKHVQNNGTLWAHIFVGQHGAQLDPSNPEYNFEKAYRMTRPLTQYLFRKKIAKTRNLLEASDEKQEVKEVVEESGPATASYYHPNFTLAFVPDIPQSMWTSLPGAVRQHYVLDPADSRDETGKRGFHYPVVFFNTFWQLKSQMVELNATLPIERLDLNIHLSTLANWQFSIMASMDENMKETARKAAQGEMNYAGSDGSELELIKETLLDTNPWLLGTTAIVSVLHMVFEMLAFKSDVGHWRKKKDNVGVSVRTILSNVVMQTIIFLYLMDNNERTSWMILFSQGMSIAIEAWKITKTVNVRIRAPQRGSTLDGILPYVVVFEDKHVLSETEEKTEEYDKIAFYWMGIGAVPLLLAYAAYSLVYETHKSWYSFIITTLVGSVYAYGFLMMIPSLYINYRLKSVAHMPARAMMYKFLNTFIDDLFAFVIKMPILHRLATLRDDVIFFVYLYQAWKYKVDYTRVNEFGQGGDDEGAEEKKASKPLQAPPDADASAGKKEEGDGVAVSTGKDKGDVKRRK